MQWIVLVIYFKRLGQFFKVFCCVLIHIAILNLKTTDQTTKKANLCRSLVISRRHRGIHRNQFSFKDAHEKQKGCYQLYYEGCFKLIIPVTLYYSFLGQSNAGKWTDWTAYHRKFHTLCRKSFKLLTKDGSELCT